MSESWHDYGFGICTSNLKEEISLPGLMELISQAPELKERVNTFINNECGGAFKDSYDILTSYVEQYGIRPCAKEYNEKTYIGIYIGDLPIQILTSYKESTGQLINSTMNNPAIFVPELKKIIYGCESWWKTIRSVDEFSKISNEDINNTWYVKLLQSMDQPEEE